MIKLEKKIEIDAPVERVFDYLIDPANVTEYTMGAERITRVRRLPNGGYQYTILGKIAGLRMEMTSEDLEILPNERIVSKMTSSLLDTLATARFERLDGDKTRVSFDAESTLHAGPLSKLGEAFLARYFDHGVEMEIATIRARLEAAKTLAGAPS
ncbi:MAG TPA: SRPBCC family protein [Ktedonobacterales bacterium]|nr:SRPBCC family protein [Ktedonobacterales bacterium]